MADPKPTPPRFGWPLDWINPWHWSGKNEPAGQLASLLLRLLALLYFCIPAYVFLGLVADILSATPRFDEIRSALLVLGGLLGAPFVIWRTWIAERQVRISQESHYTELFTKAVEQLGADKVVKVTRPEEAPDIGKGLVTWVEEKTVRNIEVRIGAIYALERVLKESKDLKVSFDEQIVDTLSAYVRENCKYPIKTLGPLENRPLPNEFDGFYEYQDSLREKLFEFRRGEMPANVSDVQAAISALKRYSIGIAFRNSINDSNFINLRNVNFQGADLSGIILSNADLTSAHLEGSDLSGAVFHGVDFTLAKMEGVNLSGATLINSQLCSSDLSCADLNFVKIVNSDLYNSELNYTSLSGSTIVNSNLSDAHFYHADLSMSTLDASKCYDTWFSSCILNCSRFIGSELIRTNLDNADISGATFRGALLECDLSNVRFDPAEIQEQMNTTFGNKERTILPEYVMIPDHWAEGGPIGSTSLKWKKWNGLKSP